MKNSLHKFRFMLAAVVLTFCLLALPGTMRADVMYTYTGKDLGPDLQVETGFTPPYTNGDYVHGYITTAAPLASGISTITDITALVTSFSFTDGVDTLTNNTSLDVEDFQVTTDSTGNIAEWEVSLEVIPGYGILSCNSFTPTCLAPGFGGGGDETFADGAVGIVTEVGSWAESPEPSGMVLLGSISLGLLGMARWRKRPALL